MKYKVGDKVKLFGGVGNGTKGEVVGIEPSYRFSFRIQGRDHTLWCDADGKPNITTDAWYSAEPDTEPTPTHLPTSFKLNPGGNEALSKAMQERLFELGFGWNGNTPAVKTVSDEGSPFLFVYVDESPRNFTHGDEDYHSNWPALTLDDLYKLKPAPKELPELEIAGRTLELKEGRVVGSEFNEDADSFEAVVNRWLKGATTPLGGHKIEVSELKIGCQMVSREELTQALQWVRNNKGAA